MLKKINNRKLIIILLVLLAIVIVNQVITNQKGERNFREYLAQIDTTAINKVELISFEKEPLIIEKKGKDNWIVKHNDKQAKADKNSINSLIQALSDLKVKKRVAIKESQWEKYEVTDSLGTRVKVYSDDNLSADMMVGRFSYKRQGQGFSMSTNARLTDEKEVYTVEGQLSMLTRRDFNGFRDHTLLNVDPAAIQQVRFTYPSDSSFMLTKDGDKWMTGNTMADSTKVAEYLKKLEGVRAHNFTENFNAETQPFYKMEVNITNGQTQTVEAYPDGEKYIFRSSQNETAVFKESENTFKRLFKPATKLQ